MSKNYFVRIEDMTWPASGSDIRELANKQRYHRTTMTEGEGLLVASVMDAYCALISLPVRARAKIIGQIKRWSVE